MLRDLSWEPCLRPRSASCFQGNESGSKQAQNQISQQEKQAKVPENRGGWEARAVEKAMRGLISCFSPLI